MGEDAIGGNSMGSYLHAGIVQRLTITKEWTHDEAGLPEVMEYLGNKLLLNPDHYHVEEKDEEYMFTLKNELLKTHTFSFLEKQFHLLPQHEYREKEWEELKTSLQNATTAEKLIELAEDRYFVGWQTATYQGACRIDWLSDGYLYAETICFLVDGKVITEGVRDTEHYLTKLIQLSQPDNPLTETVLVFVQ